MRNKFYLWIVYNMSHSQELFQRALASIPGGVNSPVRAFKGVGGDPIFFEKGQGAHLTDVDGKAYVDYVGSWGPLILGHCHPDVIQSVEHALHHSMSFGAPTESEILLAEKIIELVPSIEKIRMVNSGTEATMTAIRLARGFTNKNKIIKFNGCYHGHSDGLLVKAGSGVLTLGIPSTPGIPKSITEHTLTAEFNHLNQVESLFDSFKDDVAAVIIEPIAGNMGFVMPDEDFIHGLQDLCRANHSLLIFDEVMTGFRVGLQGAQGYFDMEPDLTTFGKVIGGGMPVGALGGKLEIMNHLAPVGPVYQAGTLSGNPLAMAAGLATLNIISEKNFFDELSIKAKKLEKGLKQIAVKHQLPFISQSLGGMFGFSFNELDSIRDFSDVSKGNESRFKAFFHGMLKEGVYFTPSMYEAGFISIAHRDDDIEKTIQAADKVMSSL